MATTAAQRNQYFQKAQARFPHLPLPLMRIFSNAWAETGDASLALQTMRQHPRYENYYKGNKREDGSLILTERQYYARKIRYEKILESFGLPKNSSFFKNKFADLVQGEKSMTRFEEDMGRLYVGIATQSQAVRQYFMQHFGEGQNLSIAAIFASALDTSKSALVYEREIESARIGGAAKAHSFDISLQEVQRLSSYGLESEAANTLFSQAARAIPTLSQMIQRHNDPDDEFTINDYTNALVVKDADDLRRLTRLVGAESSLFKTGSAIAQDQTGRYSGLIDR